LGGCLESSAKDPSSQGAGVLVTLVEVAQLGAPAVLLLVVDS